MPHLPKMVQTPHQQLVTRLFLSPEIHQNLTILQYGVAQLNEHLKQTAESNPFLTLHEPSTMRTQVDLDQYQSPIEETLADHLLMQTRLLTLTPIQKLAVTAIISVLDEAGYCRQELSVLATTTQIPLPQLQDALSLVQQLEPVGVGARDLTECLWRQAQADSNFDATAQWLLAHRQLETLALPEKWSQLPFSHQQLTQALSAIQQLDPTPGSQYCSGQATCYIVPDLCVTEAGVQLTDQLPHLAFDQRYYDELLAAADKETKRYLHAQRQHYQQLDTALSRRGETLRLIGEYLVAHQGDFLRTSEVQRLKPLSIQDCAMALGFANSTISRALQDKYLENNGQLIALRMLFPRAVTRHMSGAQLMSKIRTLLAQEAPYAPYSDLQLAQVLGQKGIKISRRTVAKYRKRAGIPGQFQRH